MCSCDHFDFLFFTFRYRLYGQTRAYSLRNGVGLYLTHGNSFTQSDGRKVSLSSMIGSSLLNIQKMAFQKEQKSGFETHQTNHEEERYLSAVCLLDDECNNFNGKPTSFLNVSETAIPQHTLHLIRKKKQNVKKLKMKK